MAAILCLYNIHIVLVSNSLVVKIVFESLIFRTPIVTYNWPIKVASDVIAKCSSFCIILCQLQLSFSKPQIVNGITPNSMNMRRNKRPKYLEQSL